ncbi:helix-turn-helix transcriptional regulator [Olivibacter sp. SDN3]|uniref:helix-turn-helix transcriptional regulator n=1 Tax=Olivibacter sp. SDN3 TaxID=2764720 RepID=UPI0016518127|nr:AraC family transcriptional regulator [Olivibacter sp. SDN3]QNL48555.1 helix-turn-helix transcriptional regulator [Olivibacter sp. SDN3]
MNEIDVLQQICLNLNEGDKLKEKLPAETLYEEDGTEVFTMKTHRHQEIILRDYQEEPYLNMFFSFQGLSSSKHLYSGIEYSLTDNQHMVGYTPFFEGDYSLKGNMLEIFGVCMKESYFQKLIVTDLACLQQFWDNVQKGVETGMTSHPMPIIWQQRSVINEMLNCIYQGQMRKLYFESKITELFFLQAEQANNLPKEGFLLLKSSDREKLNAARQFIQHHIFEPLTIRKISREIGLNEFKLKKGFRQLFGTTVFDCLTQFRMDYARQVLLDTSKTISEVAYTLGYSDPYNFSKAFKKHFGFLPSKL